MADKENIVQKEAGAGQSAQDTVDKKNRRPHSNCRFYAEGFCSNRISMFYRQARELDDLFCSVFHKCEDDK